MIEREDPREKKEDTPEDYDQWLRETEEEFQRLIESMRAPLDHLEEQLAEIEGDNKVQENEE